MNEWMNEFVRGLYDMVTGCYYREFNVDIDCIHNLKGCAFIANVSNIEIAQQPVPHLR